MLAVAFFFACLSETVYKIDPSFQVIRKAIASDFGDYNCTVRTSHGEDAFMITLKRESKKFRTSKYDKICFLTIYNLPYTLYLCMQRINLRSPSLKPVHFVAESLPLIIILSAVIGGIVLTVAAILIMILCRRSTALSLKSISGERYPARL
jgi:hypothetical protein